MKPYRPPGYISPIAAMQVVADTDLSDDQETIREKQREMFPLFLERQSFKGRNEFNADWIDRLDRQIADLRTETAGAWDDVRARSEAILRDLLFAGVLKARYINSSARRKVVPKDFWASRAAAGVLYAGEYYRQNGRGEIEAFTLLIACDELDAALAKRERANQAAVVKRQITETQILTALLKIANGKKSEPQCRTEVGAHFNTPFKDGTRWRRVWSNVSPTLKLGRGVKSDARSD